MGRALTIKNIVDKKYPAIIIPEGPWCDLLGDTVQGNGIWIVAGPSGSTKSSFVAQLAKMLAGIGKVLYDALEEYDKLSFQKRCKHFGLMEVNNKVLVVNEQLDDIAVRLKKRNPPRFVIIDSIQMMRYLRIDRWRAFVEQHKRTVFIVISQVRENKPKGALADDIFFDADIKIWVEGGKAINRGREMGATGEYVVYEDLSNKYHGE